MNFWRSLHTSKLHRLDLFATASLAYTPKTYLEQYQIMLTRLAAFKARCFAFLLCLRSSIFVPAPLPLVEALFGLLPVFVCACARLEAVDVEALAAAGGGTL